MIDLELRRTSSEAVGEVWVSRLHIWGGRRLIRRDNFSACCACYGYSASCSWYCSNISCTSVRDIVEGTSLC